jgi:hypothetical protein
MDVAAVSHDSDKNRLISGVPLPKSRLLSESWLRVRQPKFRKVHEKSGLERFERLESLRTTTPTQEMTMVR